jgi:hypothetical protein
LLSHAPCRFSSSARPTAPTRRPPRRAWPSVAGLLFSPYSPTQSSCKPPQDKRARSQTEEKGRGQGC